MTDSKVLMVTGASSDIGMALIGRISENYSLIVAHYSHMNDKLEQLKAQLGDKLLLIQADFNDEVSVSNLINQLQENDITVDDFVHLASGKCVLSPFRKSSWSQVENGIIVSVKSVYLILQFLLNRMVTKKSGKVIFMLSSNVIGEPARNQSSYVISKYALLGLFKSLNAEYSEKGIIFNAVSPDMIETKFLSDFPELILDQCRQKNRNERNLQIDEIIPIFEFLLSPAGNTVKGQNISIINP